jgi:hypothetical protein
MPSAAEHLITDRPPADPLADLIDHTREIVSDTRWNASTVGIRSGATMEDLVVHWVEPGCTGSHPHLTSRRMRRLHLVDIQHFRPAKSLVPNGS